MVKRKTGPGELVLDGKGRVRKRNCSPRTWTSDKEKQFLVALAETCNVKLAAQEAGVSPQHAYVRRKSHAAFRAASIAIAYSRLELVLLDRALNGPRSSSLTRMGARSGWSIIRTRSL
jgi:hypothetical protein